MGHFLGREGIVGLAAWAASMNRFSAIASRAGAFEK
jgi:hypothetical protein